MLGHLGLRKADIEKFCIEYFSKHRLQNHQNLQIYYIAMERFIGWFWTTSRGSKKKKKDPRIGRFHRFDRFDKVPASKDRI